MRGDGAASHSLRGRSAATQKMVDTLSTRLDQTDTAVDARIAAVKAIERRRAGHAGAPKIARRPARNRPRLPRRPGIRAASGAARPAGGAQPTRQRSQAGHGRRELSLPRCTNVFCRLHRFLLPPTPMGPFVVAFRVIFFVIEILPITFKVISSLRRRRPYDAVQAAFEEAAVADAVRLADRQLHEASAEMGARVRLRHSGRGGTAGRRRRGRDVGRTCPCHRALVRCG